MANKRQLKKQIRYICGDIATECSVAIHLIKGINVEKMNQVIRDLAALQQQSLSMVTFGFDKIPSDFENRREYNKARHAYYTQAYKVLTTDFNETIEKIVHEMNTALPVLKEEKKA